FFFRSSPSFAVKSSAISSTSGLKIVATGHRRRARGSSCAPQILLLGLADLGIVEGGLIVAAILHVLGFGRIDHVLTFGRTLEVFDIIGFPGAGQAHVLRVEGVSLDDMELVTMRNAPVDGARLKTHGIDDQRVAVPTS